MLFKITMGGEICLFIKYMYSNRYRRAGSRGMWGFLMILDDQSAVWMIDVV